MWGLSDEGEGLFGWGQASSKRWHLTWDRPREPHRKGSWGGVAETSVERGGTLAFWKGRGLASGSSRQAVVHNISTYELVLRAILNWPVLY